MGLKGALPVLGAVLGGAFLGPLIGPALGTLGTAAGGAVGTGIGSGIGSTAGGLLSGQGLKDSLKGGLIAGGTAGVGAAGLNALKGATALGSGTVSASPAAGAGASAAGTAAPASAGAGAATRGFGDVMKDLLKPGAAGAGSGAGNIAWNATPEIAGQVSGVLPGTAAGSETIGTALKNVFSNPGTGSISSLAKVAGAKALENPLGVATAASALSKGDEAYAGENELAANAADLNAQSKEMQNYLKTGTLPAGLQSSIDQAANARKAQIRSRYASMGLAGSSSEQMELANVDGWAQGQAAEQALGLLNTGLQQGQMANSLYKGIMDADMQKDKDLQEAFAGFAGSMQG